MGSSVVLDARDSSTRDAPPGGFVYERRRPELGTLYQVVRDNLQTLYAAVDDGFASPLPAFVRNELEQYLDCGLLCRGFDGTVAVRPRPVVTALPVSCVGTAPWISPYTLRWRARFGVEVALARRATAVTAIRDARHPFAPPTASNASLRLNIVRTLS